MALGLVQGIEYMYIFYFDCFCPRTDAASGITAWTEQND
jgi:hypothetical protein